MNRQEKLAKLHKGKARTNPESLKDYTLLADAMEAIVVNFSQLLKAGVDINDLDLLTDRLESIDGLSEEVATLKDAIANFPELPNEVKIASVDEFINALKEIKIEPPAVILPEQKEIKLPDYSGAVKRMAEAMSRFALATTKANSKPASQRPADYVPYRRVIKDGNSLKFDDNPSQGGGPSGGGVPTVEATGALIAIPVSNPDGSLIGGGGGLTDVQLRATAVPVAAMKYAHTMLIDVASATVTYIGEAEPGTLVSGATWRIKKITVTGSLTEIQWADGVGTFTKVYNDRATYTYA